MATKKAKKQGMTANPGIALQRTVDALGAKAFKKTAKNVSVKGPSLKQVFSEMTREAQKVKPLTIYSFEQLIREYETNVHAIVFRAPGKKRLGFLSGAYGKVESIGVTVGEKQVAPKRTYTPPKRFKPAVDSKTLQKRIREYTHLEFVVIFHNGLVHEVGAATPQPKLFGGHATPIVKKQAKAKQPVPLI